MPQYLKLFVSSPADVPNEPRADLLVGKPAQNCSCQNNSHSGQNFRSV